MHGCLRQGREMSAKCLLGWRWGLSLEWWDGPPQRLHATSLLIAAWSLEHICHCSSEVLTATPLLLSTHTHTHTHTHRGISYQRRPNTNCLLFYWFSDFCFVIRAGKLYYICVGFNLLYPCVALTRVHEIRQAHQTWRVHWSKSNLAALSRNFHHDALLISAFNNVSLA